MKHFGRTGRRRGRRKANLHTHANEEKADEFAELKKWMISQSCKHLLSDTFRLVPCYFPETGRGLKTRKSIKPGTIIVSIPLCLLITPAKALNSSFGPLIKRWSKLFTPTQMLTLFLMLEAAKGVNSVWHHYIKALPLTYTMPLYFSKDELDLLPHHILVQAEKLLKRAHQAHREVVLFCSHHWPEDVNLACWEQFRWAWCTVSSRSVFLQDENSFQEWLDLGTKDENSVALCPYLDLLNHTSTAKAQGEMNMKSGCYEILTDDTYKPHDQVFIKYGCHDNMNLFLHYGFILPFNIHNAVNFSIYDLQELRDLFHVGCWTQKMEELKKHNLDIYPFEKQLVQMVHTCSLNHLSRHLCCTREGVSWNLRAALTILAMDWKHLQDCWKMLMEEKGNEGLEHSAKEMAKHMLTKTLAERLDFLQTKHSSDQFEPASHHARLAYSLVMDEVFILQIGLQQLTTKP